MLSSSLWLSLNISKGDWTNHTITLTKWLHISLGLNPVRNILNNVLNISTKLDKIYSKYVVVCRLQCRNVTYDIISYILLMLPQEYLHVGGKLAALHMFKIVVWKRLLYSENCLKFFLYINVVPYIYQNLKWLHLLAQTTNNRRRYGVYLFPVAS